MTTAQQNTSNQNNPNGAPLSESERNAMRAYL